MLSVGYRDTALDMEWHISEGYRKRYCIIMFSNEITELSLQTVRRQLLKFLDQHYLI